jgi:hypothetical protein
MQTTEILDVQGNYVGRAWRCVVCRRLVESFYGHDVVCDCGQLYNSSGQRLNPPEQWGENGDY